VPRSTRARTADGDSGAQFYTHAGPAIALSADQRHRRPADASSGDSASDGECASASGLHRIRAAARRQQHQPARVTARPAACDCHAATRPEQRAALQPVRATATPAARRVHAAKRLEQQERQQCPLEATRLFLVSASSRRRRVLRVHSDSLRSADPPQHALVAAPINDDVLRACMSPSGVACAARWARIA
jgi:hypothetical protein